MEETNTTEVSQLKEAIVQACSGELTKDAFYSLAVEASASEETLEEFKQLLAEWDSFSKSLGKANAGVVHGYCLLISGDSTGAEEILKQNKRSEWGLYYLARTYQDRNRIAEALKLAEEGHDKFPDYLPLYYLLIELSIQAGNTEEAEKLLQKRKKPDGSSAEFHYHSGLLAERAGDYPQALQSYRQAVRSDSTHANAYFRLGDLLDLHGTEADEANDDAVVAYEACARLSPVHTHAVMNLAILYEDRERFHDAIKCYESVIKRFPNHHRARLYLGDAQAATTMFYDKEQEKKADRHSQVLKIPVSDFELSVRSRNCLQKMNIQCLGDLIMKTEQELLSYKNFGETSLSEIKEMLAQKGLRLGQGLETKAGEVGPGRNPLEATANPEVLDKPIEELELSVRSRRCMERLEVHSVRDLINKTEVELMSAKNFGMTSLNEIKKKLGELGLGLRS